MRTAARVDSEQLLRWGLSCRWPAAWAIAEARSAGRPQVGDLGHHRVPFARHCIITSAGYEEAMIVDGTSRRESLFRCTVSRMADPGSGTARSRNRFRSSSLKPSRLAGSRSNGGSGTSSVSGGTDASKAEPSADGPLST